MGSPFSLPTFIIALGPKTQIAPINKNKKLSESLCYPNTDVFYFALFSLWSEMVSSKGFNSKPWASIRNAVLWGASESPYS